jgi:hypothetical protein
MTDQNQLLRELLHRYVQQDLIAGNTDNNLFRSASAALSHPAQPAPAQPQGAGEAGWRGTHPRTGAPEFCAHTPSPSVLRDFNMRPITYADTTPPATQAAQSVPFAKVCSFNDMGGEYELLSPVKYRPPVGALLYTAQPATQQAVPEAPATVEPGKATASNLNWFDHGYEKGWNACRKAMLRAAKGEQ